MAEPAPFTALGEPDLERRVAADVAHLAAAVSSALGSSLRALLLGGGYGRGEGGGRRDADGTWRPLNDYDLVAVVDGVRRWQLGRLRERLGRLAELLAEELNLEIELSPLRVDDLPRLPFTMMWCELFAEPRVIAGDPRALDGRRRLAPAELPQLEAVRYLGNRAALLLWSRLEPLPPERAWKFVAKAWLAAGAAALIGTGEFAVGYAARQRRLESLSPGDLPPVVDLPARHAAAVAERLAPSAPPASLDAEVEAAVAGLLATWRWCEGRRLGWEPARWGDYALRPGSFREGKLAAAGNLMRQLRAFGLSGIRPGWAALEPPRARVARTLPTALAGEGIDAACRLLACEPAQVPGTCLALWRRFNA